MAKIGFKPEWKKIHTECAQEYEEQYEGRAEVVGFDEYMKWLHDSK